MTRYGNVLLVVFLGLGIADSTAIAQPTQPPTGTPSAPSAGVPDRATAGTEDRDTAPTTNQGQPSVADPTAVPPSGRVPERAADTTDTDAAAAVASRPNQPAGVVSAGELPSPEQEARGTCTTPRQAWLQLLYWLQRAKDRWEPGEAVKCVASAGLSPKERERRTVMLKQILDGRGVWIKVNHIPTNPNYRNDSGYLEYREPAVLSELGTSVYVEKVGSRWVFSAETMSKVPGMYPVTGVIQQYVPSFLKFTVAGVEFWKYLLLIVVYLVARMLRFLVVLILDRYIENLALKTKGTYLNKLVDRAGDPVGLLVMAMVFYISVPALLLPIRFTGMAIVVIKAVAAYALVWLAYRLIDVITDYMMAKAEKTESKLDDQLVPLVSKTLKVFVSIVGGLFILQNLDVNVGSLLAGVGLGGLAFALAAKDTVANFFGSVMIFIDKPFQIGDWVVIDNTEGVIEEVGFRTSRVRTFYNSIVTVPNALVTSAVVDNYGVREYRRYVANVGLTYDTPPDKVEAFCEGVRAIIAGMPGMRRDYYLVEFKEFGDSGLIIMIYCFMISDDWNAELRTRTNLNIEIMRMADQIGVSFAFPTQTVYVNQLPEMGSEKPNHYGPTTHEQLAEVIDGFGPNGQLARRDGLRLTQGYHCDVRGRGDEDGG